MIIFIILTIVIIIVIVNVVNKRYIDFVLLHSISLQKIRELNDKYKFKNIQKYELLTLDVF